VNDRHPLRGLGELPVASPLFVRWTAISSRASARRPSRFVYAALAAALLAIAVLLIVVWDASWWQAVAFALAPDAAVLYGIAPGLARGQLHPRAVPLYNALHRFWGPLVLAVAALAAGLPTSRSTARSDCGRARPTVFSEVTTGECDRIAGGARPSPEYARGRDGGACPLLP
jgi:hypothetical protein